MNWGEGMPWGPASVGQWDGELCGVSAGSWTDSPPESMPPRWTRRGYQDEILRDQSLEDAALPWGSGRVCGWKVCRAETGGEVRRPSHPCGEGVGLISEVRSQGSEPWSQRAETSVLHNRAEGWEAVNRRTRKCVRVKSSSCLLTFFVFLLLLWTDSAFLPPCHFLPPLPSFLPFAEREEGFWLIIWSNEICQAEKMWPK